MVAMLYRSLFVLGIAAFMAVAIFGGAGPTQPFQPVFPTFSNPYSAITQGSLTVGSPTRDVTTRQDATTNCPVLNATRQVCATFSGCDNTSAGRQNCLNDEINRKNFMEVSTTQSTLPFLGAAVLFFNVSNTQAYANIPWDSVRYFKLTVVCQTIQGDTNVIWFMALGTMGNSGNFYTPVECPRSAITITTFEQVVPAGFHLAVPSFFYGLDTGDSYEAAFSLGTWNESGVQPKARIYYINIQFSTDAPGGSGCQAPTGAWFPWADELACSLSNFGNQVYTFARFIIEGLWYILQWFIAIGQHITNYLAVLVWLYSIPGMPFVIQAFLDVYWTVLYGVIGVEIFRLVKPFGGD
jgi:hypothetical protein